MVKILYIIAIGLLFAAFVGFGVNTFYPSPASVVCSPTSPIPLTGTSGTTQSKTDALCSTQQQDYQIQVDSYNQNLSLILLGLAVVVIIISLFGLGKIVVIGDGITLGGIFLLFTGLAASFNAGSTTFRFVAVTLGLVIVLFLSYWKFVRE
jgi:hypothetical protein